MAMTTRTKAIASARLLLVFGSVIPTAARIESSVRTNAKRFSERRGSSGVSYPQDRVFRRLGKRVAAQVGKIDKTPGLDSFFCYPLERRLKISSASSLG